MAVETVVKTIGTSSRNYSTLQTWEDQAPVNLTTAERSNCTGFVGTFTQNESLTFVGSGATGKMLDTNNSSYITYNITAGNPATSDVITGGSSGAVATLTSGTPNFTGVIWQGQCYNDGEFVGTSAVALTISGETTSATCYLELTTATGQSFQDNASVRTNPLFYDQSKGVGVRNTGSYVAGTIVVLVQNVRISKLQIYRDGTSGACISNDTNANTTAPGIYKDLLCRSRSATALASPGAAGLYVFGGSQVINCAVILSGAAGDGILMGGAVASTMTGCTVARTSNNAAAGNGVTVGGSATGSILQSTAIFGFTVPARTPLATYFTGGGFNATEVAATTLPGSSNQYSVTYSSVTPFTVGDVTGGNFSAITSTSLAGNGFLDATNAPNDITGYARPASPTIGAWQITVSSGSRLGHLSTLGVT